MPRGPSPRSRPSPSRRPRSHGEHSRVAVRGWGVGVALAVAAASAATVATREDAPAVRDGAVAAAVRQVPERPVPRLAAPAPADLPAAPPPAPVEAAQAVPPAQGRAGAPAAGTTAAVPVGSAEQRGREALATLDYPWRELGYEIRFAAHRGGHVLGLADPQARVLTVYVREQQSTQSLRATIAHEIGHALDHVTGDDAQRARYREVRGLPAGSPWYPCGGCPDYASPAGDFAEVFTYAVAGPGDFRSRLGPPPSAAQLRDLAPLFAPPSQRPARPAASVSSASPTPSPSRSQLLPLVP